MPQLAINGGRKIRYRKFPAHSNINIQEINAVTSVIKRGVLSRFLGTWHPDFYGGPQVRAFERDWARSFKVKHAIAVNSATSGLYCAVGAVGTSPGDEIIVSPYTMSASATAPLIYSAIPVFADIEKKYFCLDPESIEKKITKFTKGIIIVDLFGQIHNVEAIRRLARKYKLWVIEDCALAPGAAYKGSFAGTFGDIGVFSLNYHKHIHTGEGGVVVTDNDRLAEKIRLIRNHAEAVLEKKKTDSLVNMVGFNYRMTELEAAIGRVQLKKLKSLLSIRQKNVAYLISQLRDIPFLTPTPIRPGASHIYYLLPFLFDTARSDGITPQKFVDAVKAELPPIANRESEGVKISYGYVSPLYLLPMYQKRIAFGNSGYPWSSPAYKGVVDYSRGICPNVEKINNMIILLDLMKPPFSKADLDDVAAAFFKVWQYRAEIK